MKFAMLFFIIFDLACLGEGKVSLNHICLLTFVFVFVFFLISFYFYFILFFFFTAFIF